MRKKLIDFFATHRVAANLLMIAMIISGLWGITHMNSQFLPSFDLNFIRVTTLWPGANAEDIEKAITTPIQEELRDLDGLKKIIARDRIGASSITLEMKAGTNMNEAVEQIQQRIDQLDDFPKEADPPKVARLLNYEEVARLIIAGGHNLQELRPLVNTYEKQLLEKGITKVSIIGLPEQEIAIQISAQKLQELGVSLDRAADFIASRSQDVPVGSIGKSSVAKELRSSNKQRTVQGFIDLPLIHDNQGRLLRLGDIATVTKRADSDQTFVTYQGKPAVQMTLFRTENSSALDSATILHEWLKTAKANAPEGILIKPYFERWKHIKDRISLLLKNGFWGLTFILLLLFFFLNFRIALWVAIGIPTSFLAALAVLFLLGGSINMVSLFAMIMTLGIIVDDSIVVGEEVLSRVQKGVKLTEAISRGTQVMLTPIVASSLTTIVAFLPLMFVSGIIGQILFDIPMVAICVILASLLECFFVLPGHLYQNIRPKKFRDPILQPHFEKFRDNYFRPFVSLATKNAWTTISLVAAIALITLGVLAGGYLQFHFFPSPEGSDIQANVQFSAGTPPKKVANFIGELERSLQETDDFFSKKTGEKLIVAYSVLRNQSTRSHERIVKKGEQYVSLYLELISPDQRKITNQEFIQRWKKNVALPDGVESFTAQAIRGGPPGSDLDIQVSGSNLSKVKKASIELSNILSMTPGVNNIADELPFGRSHVVFELNPQAHALNLTTGDIGTQLRAAFNGKQVQVFHEPSEKIKVKVMLPDHERNQPSTLKTLPIVTKNKTTVPLSSVVTLTTQQGFDELLQINGKLSNKITAQIDSKVNNMNRILASLNQKILPTLAKKYNVTFRFGGRKESQTETLNDMLYGVLLAFAFIYLILAWVFSSYGWPLLIMISIPLGLIGAIWGHVILHMSLTVLSLFGLFGLSGIVINDSIILVNRYKKLRHETDLPFDQAIIEAACQRLRPVLLTSLTTIAGLSPLLFEGSLQAQFLIPMAVSIVFGLIFATFLILVLLPAMLHTYELKVAKTRIE